MPTSGAAEPAAHFPFTHVRLGPQSFVLSVPVVRHTAFTAALPTSDVVNKHLSVLLRRTTFFTPFESAVSDLYCCLTRSTSVIGPGGSSAPKLVHVIFLLISDFDITVPLSSFILVAVLVLVPEAAAHFPATHVRGALQILFASVPVVTHTAFNAALPTTGAAEAAAHLPATHVNPVLQSFFKSVPDGTHTAFNAAVPTVAPPLIESRSFRDNRDLYLSLARQVRGILVYTLIFNKTKGNCRIKIYLPCCAKVKHPFQRCLN